MKIHPEKNVLAGKTVKLKHFVVGYSNKDFTVADWWDRLAGRSWQVCDNSPECIHYAVRSHKAGLPIDDEVLYGKIGTLGYLFHVSEIDLEPNL